VSEPAPPKKRSRPELGTVPTYDDLFIGLSIRVGWLIELSHLSAPVQLLGFLLWAAASVRGRLTFSVSNAGLARHGITPDAKTRRLKKLEDAGLISIDRREKRSPIVTILPLAGPIVSRKGEKKNDERD
jgi:DNA-binding transcriptional ArsR family regulator